MAHSHGSIGDVSKAFYPAILTLNHVNLIEVSPLDIDALDALLDGAFLARGIGNLEAFVIALDETHKSYTSPNYLWFKARRERFVYVDRIIVSAASRGKGRARRLYADLIEHAIAAGHKIVACEINAKPPNPASDAFHAALGFREVGRASIHGGAKEVRYLELELAP